MRVISIDPGYERLGIAIIEKLPNTKEKEILCYSDCFKTNSKIPFYERVHLIALEVNRVIKKYQPEAMAVETLFFSKNQKTAMLVSEARGVIIEQASVNEIPIFEYDPVEIKVAITGYGKSDKHQIVSMIPKLIKMETKVTHDDEYDAIAVGLTFFAVDGRRHLLSTDCKKI